MRKKKIQWAWVAGLAIELYLTSDYLLDGEVGWAVFAAFFAGANFGCLLLHHTAPDENPPSNSTQQGWAKRKKR